MPMMSDTNNLADTQVVARLISPICLDCGTPMRLAHITPHRRDDSEIRAYACGCGNEILQTVSLRADRAIIPVP